MQVQEQREPTIFGVPLMQLFVGGLLFLSLLYSRRDLTVLCVLILGLMALTRLWSVLSLRGVNVSFSLDKRKVFPGERFKLLAEAKNTRFFPFRLRITFPLNGTAPLFLRGEELSFKGSLLWYARVKFHRELAAAGRGVYLMGRPHLKVSDLLGFYPREKETNQDLQLIVYPRLIQLNPVPLAAMEFFGRPGSRSPVQDPVYLLGTRDYQCSQPARMIHWKASVRHQRLQEKVFEPSEQPKVMLLLDVGQFAEEKAADAFERTLEGIASMAVGLDRKGFSIGLAANGVLEGKGQAVLAVRRGPQQIQTLLEALARLKMEREGDLFSILQRGIPISHGLSCIHFAFRKDALPLSAREHFLSRRIPLVQVVSSLSPGEAPSLRPGGLFLLDDLAAPERVQG